MNLNNLLEMQGMLILLLLLGMILSRIKLVDENAKTLLTNLVIYITLPCSILQSFMVEFDEQILASGAIIFVVAIGIQVGSMLLSTLLFPKYKEKRKKVLQYATICSNAGILGNPIAEGAFGAIGLLYASFFLIPQRTFMWSFGLRYFTMMPNRRQLWKRILTHPCIIAVGLGIFIMVFTIPIPGVIEATIQSVAKSNTFLSMVLIGSILTQVEWKKAVDKHSLYYCFIRLILVPALVFGVLSLIHQVAAMDPVVIGVSVLLSAMPAASVTAVMANKYGQDALFAAKIVALSTVLSMVTAPFWCYICIYNVFS